MAGFSPAGPGPRSTFWKAGRHSSCSSTRSVNALKSQLVKAELAGRAGAGVGRQRPPALRVLCGSHKRECWRGLWRRGGWWGGEAAGFNSRSTSHLSYCRIDVCLEAENALGPFFPPLAGMKSLKQNKMLLISRLFWAPVADCLLPRTSAHAGCSKNGFNQLKSGMNEHLAVAAHCCQSKKQPLMARHGPRGSILPSRPDAHPPHTSCPCGAGWRLG